MRAGWSDALKPFRRRSRESAASISPAVMKSAADDSVRRTVAIFSCMAKTLTASDLVQHKTLDRLLALGETNQASICTDHHASLLSSLDELRAIDTRSSNDEPWRWGPRVISSGSRAYSIILRVFPKRKQRYSHWRTRDEPEIANNATSIWRELFRIFAGTATPFLERLNTLKTRLLVPLNIQPTWSSRSQVRCDPSTGTRTLDQKPSLETRANPCIRTQIRKHGMLR